MRYELFSAATSKSSIFFEISALCVSRGKGKKETPWLKLLNYIYSSGFIFDPKKKKSAKILTYRMQGV